MTKRQISLNALHMCSPSQVTAGLWSHPDDTGINYKNIEYWTNLAGLAEKGLFDAIFLADPIGISDVYQGSHDAALKAGGTAPANDPSLVISAMAAVTRDIGFAVTANISYEHPFVVARRFSTLDHLTHGRIAINLVTGASQAGARAMGVDLRAHDDRYALAEDYMTCIYDLWERSWEDDAVEADRDKRIYVRPGSVHRISCEGPVFRTDAVHMCEPSPQRTPVLYQAGASDRGREFAARHAEAVFVVGHAKDSIRDVSRDLRQRAAAFGRDPSSLKIMLGATVVVGRTRQEALDRQKEIQRHVDIEGSLAIFSSFIGKDLSTYSPNQELREFDSNAFRTIADLMSRMSPEGPPKLSDLVRFGPVPGKEAFIVGSAEEVADELIAWMDEADIDGFNLARTIEPQGMSDFIQLVVPILQERGRYKTAYASGSLRNKLFGNGDRLKPPHPAADEAPAVQREEVKAS